MSFASRWAKRKYDKERKERDRGVGGRDVGAVYRWKCRSNTGCVSVPVWQREALLLGSFYFPSSFG